MCRALIGATIFASLLVEWRAVHLPNLLANCFTVESDSTFLYRGSEAVWEVSNGSEIDGISGSQILVSWGWFIPFQYNIEQKQLAAVNQSAVRSAINWWIIYLMAARSWIKI